VDILTDEDLAAKLPLVFRTLRGEKVPDEQLNQLAEKIRSLLLRASRQYCSPEEELIECPECGKFVLTDDARAFLKGDDEEAAAWRRRLLPVVRNVPAGMLTWIYYDPNSQGPAAEYQPLSHS